MIDFDKLFNLIPFENKITKIHHIGFLIPFDMSSIDLSKICDKFCTINILQAEVGYKIHNGFIIELIKPINQRSILFKSSCKISEITFDHFGYLKSNFSFEKNKKYLKISKFYTCLFKTNVEFILSDNQKIELVYDSL